jgi:hypothetical protein
MDCHEVANPDHFVSRPLLRDNRGLEVRVYTSELVIPDMVEAYESRASELSDDVFELRFENDAEFETQFEYHSSEVLSDLEKTGAHRRGITVVESGEHTGYVKHTGIRSVDTDSIELYEDIYRAAKTIGLPTVTHAFGDDWSATKKFPDSKKLSQPQFREIVENEGSDEVGVDWLITALAKTILLGLHDAPPDFYFQEETGEFRALDLDFNRHPFAMQKCLMNLTVATIQVFSMPVTELITARAHDMAVYLIEYADWFSLSDYRSEIQHNILY